jgi:hypothetical protein
MGNEFEVWSWVPSQLAAHGYQWIQVYAGEDKAEAFRIVESEKARGVGCVKLEWR